MGGLAIKRLVVLLPLFYMLAGCSNGDTSALRDGELRLGIVGAEAPDSPIPNDIVWPSEQADPLVTEATRITLVARDAKGNIVPSLASRWHVSDDGLHYIFRLRKAHWADGQTIGAADVVVTYRHFLKERKHHPYRALMDRIANAPAIMKGKQSVTSLGVMAPLPHIVEIHLEAPYPGLLRLLSQPGLAIHPKNTPASTLASTPGAFKIEQAGKVKQSKAPSNKKTPQSHLTRLVRNPDYFDARKVALNTVTLMADGDAYRLVQGFAAGRLDLVQGEGTAGLNVASLSPRGTLYTEESWGVYGYLINMHKTPLSDPEVRHALAMSIDRQMLVRKLFPQHNPGPILGLIPPNLPSYKLGVRPDWATLPMQDRRARAQDILHKVGHGPHRPLRLTLTYPKGAEHEAVVRAVAQSWKPLGIELVGVPHDMAEYVDALTQGQFDLAMVERISPLDEPRLFLSAFRCSTSPGTCNARIDHLLDDVHQSDSPQERQEILRQTERSLIDIMPMIPLFTPMRWALVSTHISGWEPNIYGAHPITQLAIQEKKR